LEEKFVMQREVHVDKENVEVNSRRQVNIENNAAPSFHIKQKE